MPIKKRRRILNIIKTGVFASREEMDEMEKLWEICSQTRDWNPALQAAHQLALSHGLPELPCGRTYIVDLVGEFVKQEVDGKAVQ